MSSPREPTLSILIATKDRPDSLRETLVHLAGCSSVQSHEVVVIDSGSEAPLSPSVLDVPGLGRTRLFREPQSDGIFGASPNPSAADSRGDPRSSI